MERSLMLFNPDIVPKEEYLKEWPKHYYEIEDINMREACLKKYLKEHSDSLMDIRRLEIFEKRFGKKVKKERGDGFIKSFMMILVAYQNNLHSFDVTRRRKELVSELTSLCILDFLRDELLYEEWRNFADVYMDTTTTHSYRSTLFGVVTLKDEAVAARIAREIDSVTRLAPKEFHLESECEKLREIMIASFVSKVKNGEAHWNSYMNSRYAAEGGKEGQS